MIILSADHNTNPNWKLTKRALESLAYINFSAVVLPFHFWSRLSPDQFENLIFPGNLNFWGRKCFTLRDPRSLCKDSCFVNWFIDETFKSYFEDVLSDHFVHKGESLILKKSQLPKTRKNHIHTWIPLGRSNSLSPCTVQGEIPGVFPGRGGGGGVGIEGSNLSAHYLCEPNCRGS